MYGRAGFIRLMHLKFFTLGPAEFYELTLLTLEGFYPFSRKFSRCAGKQCLTSSAFPGRAVRYGQWFT